MKGGRCFLSRSVARLYERNDALNARRSPLGQAQPPTSSDLIPSSTNDKKPALSWAAPISLRPEIRNISRVPIAEVPARAARCFPSRSASSRQSPELPPPLLAPSANDAAKARLTQWYASLGSSTGCKAKPSFCILTSDANSRSFAR